MIGIIKKIKLISSSRFLMRRSIYRFVKSNVQGSSYEKVLDIGAGKKPYRNLIKTKKYICLDIENRTNENDVVIADANRRIPLKNDCCDLILATEVLEHLKNPSMFISESYRLLKNKGTFILTTPLVWPIHEAPNDFFRYTEYGLLYLLKEAGFKDAKVTKNYGYNSSMCQLLILNKRKKYQIPLVILFNILGLFFSKTNESKEFYLSNFVVARK